MMPYLSLAIWVPIVAGLAVLAVGPRPRRRRRALDRSRRRDRRISSSRCRSGCTFRPAPPTMQFVERSDWIPRFDIHYFLGVDGISMLFVLLNSLMTLVVVWSAWEVIQVRVAQYMAAFLIQSGLINGAFSRARRHPVLHVLRGDADPDVPHHRRLGRPESGVRGGQVLPLHAAGLAPDAGGAHLPVRRVRARSRSSSGIASRCRSRCRCCSSSRSSFRSRSRCRCGRCIPGCPTRTSKRRPAAR